MANPWACKTCGKAWPVASLARDCEKRHEPHKAPVSEETS